VVALSLEKLAAARYGRGCAWDRAREENEQRGREAVVRGVFVSASRVQHRRMEATRHRISELSRPQSEFTFVNFLNALN
jgi:hypothetical protein